MTFDVLTGRHFEFPAETLAEIAGVIIPTGFGNGGDAAMSLRNQTSGLLHAGFEDVIPNSGMSGTAVNGTEILSADEIRPGKKPRFYLMWA